MSNDDQGRDNREPEHEIYLGERRSLVKAEAKAASNFAKYNPRSELGDDWNANCRTFLHGRFRLPKSECPGGRVIAKNQTQ